MALEVVFRKTGREIKIAIQRRRQQLEARLAGRNAALDTFMKDPAKVRSYMVRSSTQQYPGMHGRQGYTLYAQNEISSEEMQEIVQLCRRIFEIEQELHRLLLVQNHLSDDQQFDLSYTDLIGYGFEASLESE